MPRGVLQFTSRLVRTTTSRFGADERGATAVEFALVAAPFFAFLLAILEAGLNLWMQQVLETRVSEMSRRLYTGQFQAEARQNNLDLSTIQEAFRQEICGKPGAEKAVLFDCSKLVVDVRSAKSTRPAPVVDRALNPDFGSTGSNYGQPGEKQFWVVRAAIRVPVFFPILGAGNSNLSDSEKLIMAAVAFKTEPFGDNP